MYNVYFIVSYGQLSNLLYHLYSTLFYYGIYNDFEMTDKVTIFMTFYL